MNVRALIQQSSKNWLKFGAVNRAQIIKKMEFIANIARKISIKKLASW